ncbi:MAG: DNA translocase FtsK 4TM domain-containing protein, partial [Bacteroidota bacterium]|nr:DNA translocase FtsK 4TM domain-containing protein [Bacteroidota bacterium]
MHIRLKKSKKKSSFRFSKITAPFKNEKNHKKVGFIFLLISIYLLIACISFLYNWKNDLDKISGNWTELLSNTEILVSNSLGKLGALISHWLIFQGFGIASFIVIALLILIGLKGIKINTLPIGKSIKHGLTSMVWLSLFFGHFFTDNLILGGGVGYECNIWLNTMLGTIGPKLFLLVSLIVIWFP